MARPTDAGFPDAPYPSWASNTNAATGPNVGNLTKIQPSSGFIADGWKQDDVPPGEYQNWWQDLAKRWIKYLDEPAVNAGTKYPLASRVVSRASKMLWILQDPTFCHIDVTGDGTGTFNIDNIGSLVFDNTTGAGGSAAALLPLEIPNGATTTIQLTVKAGSGHTALPNNHALRARTIRKDIGSGAVIPGAWVVDPSATFALYETTHSFSTTSIGGADTFGFAYYLQVQSEEGTGTTVRNGARVISVLLNHTITSMDDGAS